MTFFKSLYSIKKLVDGTLEREFTKASNASVCGWFYIKEVHEGVFKHLVLNCTINRGACKRTYLTGTFIQHLTHFCLGFLGFAFRYGVQNYAPCHYFWQRHATFTKSGTYIDHNKSFKKLLKIVWCREQFF